MKFFIDLVTHLSKNVYRGKTKKIKQNKTKNETEGLYYKKWM